MTEPIRRHPVLITQAMMTLAHLAKRPPILGIGSGERLNVDPYGLDFSHPVGRLEEEVLGIIRMCLSSRGLLAPIFGFLLMGAIAGSLVAYLRLSGKKVPAFRVFNILGVTFFLPFVVLQPLDLLVITTVGWNLAIITTVHTLVLVDLPPWKGKGGRSVSVGQAGSKH